MSRAARLTPGVLAALIVLVTWPAPVKAEAFHVPVPVVKKLANGLEVAVFPSSRLPIVQMQLLIPAGAVDDPAGKAGLAHLTAEMLDQGSTSRSATQYGEELERLGGSVVASATRDYTTLSAAFLARDFETGMDLLSDAVISPLFGHEELDRAKLKVARAALQIRQSPSSLADENIWSLLFRDRAYGRSPFGDPDSLATLTRDAVRAFHRARYTPDHAILAIGGDVTPDRAFAAAEEWLGRWTGTSTPATRPLPEPPPSPIIRVIDAPASVAEVRLGWIGPRRGQADERTVSFVNALLGGASSRLSRRAEAGEVPSDARSSFLALADAGAFVVSASMSPDSARAGVERLRAEVGRLASSPPEEPEIAPIRRTVRNVFPMAFETLGGLIGQWTSARFYHLPDGHFDRYDEQLRTIGAADLAAAARRYLDLEHVAIVAVGPAKKLSAQLATLGTVEVRSAGLGVPAAAAAPTTPPPTRAQQTRGLELLKKAVVAHGGKTRLAGIRDSRVDAEVTLTMSGREMLGTMRQIRKEPYRMVYTTSFSGFGTQQILNGDRAWASTLPASGEEKAMDSLGVAGMRSGFASDIPHLLLGALEPGAQLASRGRGKSGAKPVDVVEVVSATGQRRLLQFDPTTHRLVGMEQHESAAAGSGFTASRRYRDFRPVKGVQWPFVEERWLNGERVMLITVKTVVLDAGVDEALFEKPEAPMSLPSR